EPEREPDSEARAESEPAGADPAPPGPTTPAPSPPAPAASPRGRGVEIRVRLSTILGRDRHPGHIPGFIGPVHAELALHTVTANTGGPWRYVLCDQTGMLTKTGPLRARPTGTPRTGTGTVEIQVDPTLLEELATDPDQAGPWAPIIRELHRHAATPPE